MKRVYFLSTCDKCRRILSSLENRSDYEHVDIKIKHISPEILDNLAGFVGSYEALFNKRAIKFKDPSIRESIKRDLDFRRLILEEYTFLKRPIFINDDKIGIEKPI
ncbi:MAG: arsenate reductase family protein [Crocinitomicaceae bacterium]